MYIAKESVASAINYFKEQDYSKAEQIGLFFYFKAAGMNGDNYIVYKKWGDFSSSEKENNMRILYDLAGIFDAKSETGNKYTALFPFSISRAIKQSSFYNGGSPFRVLGSRISDTLDNSLVSTFVERSSADKNRLRFGVNYVKYIRERLLRDKPIPINKFVAWVYRFWNIESPEGADDQELTDALILSLIRDFHITTEEFNSLFDFDNTALSFSDNAISGDDLRAELSINDPQCQPEIQNNATPDYMPLAKSITNGDISQMLVKRGDQLTRDKILTYLRETDNRNKEAAKWDSLSDIEKAIITCYKEERFYKQDIDEEYKKFANRFGKDAISKLSGKELLYTMFGMKAEQSLVYCLENQTNYFGGIAGRRWVLFLYQKNGQWISASNQYGKNITEEQAIELATQYRDNFVKLFTYIEEGINSNAFDSLSGYDDMQQKIKDILGGAFYKRQWVRKYLHMLYPQLFMNAYSELWVNKIFRVAKIVPEKSYYLCCGQFSLLSRKLGIPTVYLHYVLQALDDSEHDEDREDEEDVLELNDEAGGGLSEADLERNRLATGCNVLLYGVPGSGKSWTIEHEYIKRGSQVERLVFHPDYTYSDFVGQILPCVADDGQVSYEFTPGPFTNILREAYQNPKIEYILVIEEINRGNAPAIFGEIFQLLDRKIDAENNDDGYPIGSSEYGITNARVAKIVYGDAKHKVRIPSNLSIIGTMNTSDQNVFTLDTAFQRRWQMRLIENNFENVNRDFAEYPILDTTVTWERFCTEINKIIVGNGARTTSSEDKRLGAYFIHKRDLTFDSNMGDLKDGTYDALRKKESAQTITEEEKTQLATIRSAMMQNRRFPEKVIKYLWDDAFKFNREAIFDVGAYQSLEDIIRAFLYSSGRDRMNIFSESVRGAIFNTEA